MVRLRRLLPSARLGVPVAHPPIHAVFHKALDARILTAGRRRGVSACPHCGRSSSELLDLAAIQREYGVTRAVAERFMFQLPKIRPEGVRKVYVRRTDLDRYLDRSTVAA